MNIAAKSVVNVIAGLVVGLLVILVVAHILLSPAVERHAPRDLPWQLPDYRDASGRWFIREDGKIHTEVEHLFLRDISPRMVSWFYRVLPISTVELRGEILPLYHIFHPFEHGSIRVLQTAPSGIAGMSAGAMIERKEWFGPYDSQGRARIVELSETGMLAVPEVAGLSIGEVRHEFSTESGGTLYRVETVIGSDLPVLGPLINLYLRNVVFHPGMLKEWRRHQIQEVSSLQFFLPQIYAQRENGNHFVL